MHTRRHHLRSLLVRRLVVCAVWGMVTGLLIALAFVSLLR